MNGEPQILDFVMCDRYLAAYEDEETKCFFLPVDAIALILDHHPGITPDEPEAVESRHLCPVVLTDAGLELAESLPGFVGLLRRDRDHAEAAVKLFADVLDSASIIKLFHQAL